MTKKPDPIKHCEACTVELKRKRYNGTLEDRGVFGRRKYCDRICMARAFEGDMSKMTRSGVQIRIQALKRSDCERCGSDRKLHIHHKDRNWRNNDIGNLMTLCPPCHGQEHSSDYSAAKRKRLMGL